MPRANCGDFGYTSKVTKIVIPSTSRGTALYVRGGPVATRKDNFLECCESFLRWGCWYRCCCFFSHDHCYTPDPVLWAGTWPQYALERPPGEPKAESEAAAAPPPNGQAQILFYVTGPRMRNLFLIQETERLLPHCGHLLKGLNGCLVFNSSTTSRGRCHKQDLKSIYSDPATSWGLMDSRCHPPPKTGKLLERQTTTQPGQFTWNVCARK